MKNVGKNLVMKDISMLLTSSRGTADHQAELNTLLDILLSPHLNLGQQQLAVRNSNGRSRSELMVVATYGVHCESCCVRAIAKNQTEIETKSARI